MTTLKTRDIFALGFMTLRSFWALATSSSHPAWAWRLANSSGLPPWALLTGVGLPLLGVVALARVGGGLDTLTSPIGKAAGTLMGLSIYLTIGPSLPPRAQRRCRLKWAWRRLPATRRKRC